MLDRRAVALLITLGFLLCIGGRQASAQADETLRIASIPIDVGAEVYYAQAKGFFKEAGIEAQVQSISNGPAIAAAVASGAVDIGFSNVVSLAEAFKRGVPITIVAPGGTYDTKAPTSVCVVATKSTIVRASQLNGKTIATNALKSIAEFGPRAWIDANGGDSSTVTFIEMPLSEIGSALTRGTVSAAVLAEPTTTLFKKTTRLLSKCYDAVAPNFVISAFFTTTTWAQSHPKLLRAFQDVMRATAVWANQNRAETADILAKEAKIDPDVAHAMVRSTYPLQTTPRSIQPVIDIAAKYGGLNSSFNAAEIIYK